MTLHDSVYTAIVISDAVYTEFENIYIGRVACSVKNMGLTLDDSTPDRTYTQ